MWVAGGYPVLVTAVGVLWFAFLKSQKEKGQAEAALLEEVKSSRDSWKYLRDKIGEKTRGRRRGGAP